MSSKKRDKAKPSRDTTLKRVKDIEARIGVPHEVQDLMDRLDSRAQRPLTTAARALASFPTLRSDLSVQVTMTDLVFDLDGGATNAHFARVYLEGSNSDIASSARPHGVLPRQISGSTVRVVMETLGNPGELGKFNVQGALQPSISLLADLSPSIKLLIVR